MENQNLDYVKEVSERTGFNNEEVIKKWLKITNNNVDRTCDVINKMKPFVQDVQKNEPENNQTVFCNNTASEVKTEETVGDNSQNDEVVSEPDTTYDNGISFSYEKYMSMYFKTMENLTTAINKLTDAILNGKAN